MLPQNIIVSYTMQDSLKDAVSQKFIAHFKGQLKNSVFLDSSNIKQHRLIYPSANTIAFSTLSVSFENQKQQSFITTLPGSHGIVCMAQSQNKRYLAWCEETDTAPVIFIADLLNNSKKKVHANTEIKGSKYICLAFNGNEVTDPKYLAALTNGPQQQVLLLHIDKMKSNLHSLDKLDKQNIDRFTHLFYYREQDSLVVFGKGNIKFYKVSPQKLLPKDSPFARREMSEKDFNFTSYCILKDGLVIGTETGDLLYFTMNGEFKALLSCSPGQHYTIQTLVCLSGKTFIAGGSDGFLSLFQKTESKDAKNLYTVSQRKLSIGDYKGRITNLLTTPKEDQLFVGLNTGILLRVSLDKNINHSVEHALQWFHTETICGIDVCLRKSIVATCANDRSVRLWNYLQKNNLDIIKIFQQRPLSLSLHPSGLHLIVSFPDRVRILNILNGSLSVCKDLSIKNCSQVKFSHGGHLFAAVNNVMVQLFAFYTLDQPPHYQFKAQAGKFTTITWQEDDLALFLGTADGFVFYYKLEDPSVRLQVLSAPGFTVRSIAALFTQKDQKLGLINERTVYVGGCFHSSVLQENKWIYEVRINPRQTEKDREAKDDKSYVVSQPNKIYTYADVSKVAFLHSHRVLVYITEKNQSTLRYCRYPLKESKEVYEVHSHSTRATQLAISPDDNYIFTAGMEGQFITYQFKDNNSKTKIEMPDLSQEFLFSSSQLAFLKSRLQKLRFNNNVIKEGKERENKEAKEANDRLLNQLHLKMSEREKAEKIKFSKEIDEIALMEREQVKLLSKLQLEHKDKRETIQKDYSEKILLEQTRFSELGKTKQAENKKFNEIVLAIKNVHNKRKHKKQEEFQIQLAKQKTQLYQAQKIEKIKRMQYQHEQEAFEAQAQKEIKARKQQNEVIIKTLQQQNNKAQNEKLSKKKILQNQQRNLQQQKHHLKNTLQDIQKIKQKHQDNLQKKQSQAKQIQERQKTIRDKVTRINELKKKTQELEKFKFVLDYKIKQLKRDIGPREEQIAKMREQIANMNSQILHFKQTNENMNLIVKDVLSKRNGMDKQLTELVKKEASLQSYIKNFQYDLNDLQGHLSQYKTLKTKIIDLYRKYVQEDSARQTEGIDQQKQFIKERAHLESTVKGLKEKFKKSIDLHQADNRRIMSQNEELISQINDLKREKKNLKDQTMKKQMQKQNMIKLMREREESMQMYDKLVQDYNHLLEFQRKNRQKKD